MKVLILLGLVAAAYASVIPSPEDGGLVGVIQERLIPLGEKLRQAEEQSLSQRIVGGTPSELGAFPYQVGLLVSFIGITGTGVCGGSLLSATTVASAAHCWFDGINQGNLVTVVLGSITLFQGGTRVETTDVVQHPSWSPSLIRNDVNVIRFNAVTFSPTISPIALPSGSSLDDNFVGSIVTASGFGINDEGSLTTGQFKSHVELEVITNTLCSLSFPFIVQDSNICTSGEGGRGTCQGDSGGPIAKYIDGTNTLVGITSFGSARGCDSGRPAAYARVTSFIDFFRQFV